MASPSYGSVLLVDDDHAIRESVAGILTDAGYRVHCAQNGQEALAFLRGETPPDLVLLDLIMPVTRGFDVIAAWRQTAKLAAIPFLVMSARHSALMVNDDFNVSALRKPFSVEELLAAVTGLCRLTPAAQQETSAD